MNATTRKLVLLLVLVVIWALVWEARLNDWRPFQRAPASAAPPAPPPAAAAPAPVEDDGTAPVLATIAWADPENPAAIPIDFRGNVFLFETRLGLQFWDSASHAQSPLQGAAAEARLIDTAWARVQTNLRHGTLFAVRTGPRPAPALLYWVQDEHRQVDYRLALPAGFTPSALLRIGNDAALVCASSARQAILVRLGDGGLEQLAASPDLQVTDLWRQVQNRIVGPVAGFGEVGEPENGPYRARPRPLVFDTRACAWKANDLPEPLAGAAGLEILPQSTNAGMMIAAASWRDAATGLPRTLDTPLLWSAKEEAWLAHKASELPGLAPARQPGIVDKASAYAADAVRGRFAFLAATEDRWRESTRRLPPADGLKLLPAGADGVLALLIDARHPGRVVRLEPEKEKWLDARLPRSLSSETTAVPIAGGKMLIVGVAGNESMTIVPGEPHVETLPGLPQPGQRHTGIQLQDGSVLVFGGLPQGCFASEMKRCSASPQGGFRWLPAEKRWQPLPTLNLPFAAGEAFDGGNADIVYGYARNDVALRGDALYYMSGNAAMLSGETRIEPSILYRWRLQDGAQALARTRLSRYGVSLIALDDGRLAAIGGAAADETPDTRVDATRSCEIYDPSANQWSWGPAPVYPRGRAVKLANGRIFKLSLLGYNATDADYAAETADPKLAAWTAAPRFPLRHPATVRLMQAVGNQVIIVMDQPADRYLLWDDDSRSWQVRPLPRQSDWGLDNQPLFIAPGGSGKLLLVYPRSVDYLAWPPG